MGSKTGEIVAYIVENGLIPQFILLVAIWGTVIYLLLSHQVVPEWLQDGALTILGYFFHVVTSSNEGQNSG